MPAARPRRAPQVLRRILSGECRDQATRQRSPFRASSLDLSVDVYPQIDACDECAEECFDHLSEAVDVPPGEPARCEICGNENAASRGLGEHG